MELDFATKEDLRELEGRLLQKLEQITEALYGNSMPDYLTQKQTLEFLDMTDKSLVKLRKEGQLPYSKIGHRVFYAYKDVMKLMERNKRIR